MSAPAQQALFVGDEATIASAMALLIHYYDLAPASAHLLLNKWLQSCPADWVRSAVIEALYQGRYRAVSVEQILAFWLRRGKLTSHFNREFEAIIAVPIQQEVVRSQVTAIAALPRIQPPQPMVLQPSATATEEDAMDPMVRERSPQMHQPPIGQFTPAEDPSGFSTRLKEVAGQFQLSNPALLKAAEPESQQPNSQQPESIKLENSPSEDSVSE